MTFSHDQFKFSMTLGKAVTCEKFQDFSLFKDIFGPKTVNQTQKQLKKQYIIP